MAKTPENFYLLPFIITWFYCSVKSVWWILEIHCKILNCVLTFPKNYDTMKADSGQG